MITTIRILLRGETLFAASYLEYNQRHIDNIYTRWRSNASREHQPYQMQIVTPLDETLIDFLPECCD